MFRGSSATPSQEASMFTEQMVMVSLRGTKLIKKLGFYSAAHEPKTSILQSRNSWAVK